jgi:ABC-type sugar transport system permease subunit
MMFLAGLQAIPGELYEAAEIDGADVFGRFRNITLPGLANVMITARNLASGAGNPSPPRATRRWAIK